MLRLFEQNYEDKNDKDIFLISGDALVVMYHVLTKIFIIMGIHLKKLGFVKNLHLQYTNYLLIMMIYYDLKDNLDITHNGKNNIRTAIGMLS